MFLELNIIYLLQKASHNPLALTGVRFFPSLTSTWSAPFDDVREFETDFVLNFLKLRLFPLGCDGDDADSGGINFNPTITSPLYDGRSSNGSL